MKLTTRLVFREIGCVTCRVDNGETAGGGIYMRHLSKLRKSSINLKVMFQILTSRKELASRQVNLITNSDNPNGHVSLHSKLTATWQSCCQTHIYLLSWTEYEVTNNFFSRRQTDSHFLSYVSPSPL